MPEATPRVRRRPPPSPQAQQSAPVPLTLVLQSRSVRDTLNNLILKSPQNWRERRTMLKPGSPAATRADPTLLSHARSLSLSRAQRRASASPSSPSRARCAPRYVHAFRGQRASLGPRLCIAGGGMGRNKVRRPPDVRFWALDPPRVSPTLTRSLATLRVAGSACRTKASRACRPR